MDCHICKSKYTNNKSIYYCSNCGHTYQKYNGDVVEYHKTIYRTLSSHQRSAKEFDANGNVTQEFHNIRLPIVKKRLSIIKDYIGYDCSCLDIGSGAGTFAYELSKITHKVDCLELADSLVKESNRLELKTYQEDFLTIDIAEKYDVVFAWHVLEHVSDPLAFINKCSVISKSYVIIEVPFGRKVKSDFDGHSHHFSKESLSRCFKESNLNIINIQDGVQLPSILIVGKKC